MTPPARRAPRALGGRIVPQPARFPALPSPSGTAGLRQLRIGQPNVELYAARAYRFGNMNNHLDAERKLRLSSSG